MRAGGGGPAPSAGGGRRDVLTRAYLASILF